MSMFEGRVPMYIEEGEAIDALIAQYGPGSISRRDPDDKGPLLFKLPDGRIFEVSEGETQLVREARDG